MQSQKLKQYPSDINDEEWAFVAPYLTLMREDAIQRTYPMRDMFDAIRWVVRSGSPWRYLPSDFPPWNTVYQQARRWMKAGVFEELVHDLREILRKKKGKDGKASAAIFDSRTIQSTPESGHRAGYDGAKKKKGSKVHMAVDSLGLLLTLHVSPANEDDRAHVEFLCENVQKATDGNVKIAWADQGYDGNDADAMAALNEIELEVVHYPPGRRGFVLLPRRWVVERSFGWMSRFRRLARDVERFPETVESFHFLAFSILMLNRMRL